MAGSDVVSPGAIPGSGFALRTESLDDELYVTTYEDEDSEEDLDFDKPKKRSVSKANNQQNNLTTMDYIQYLTEALGDWSPEEPPVERVTKAEAKIIVADRFPTWTIQKIDAFVESGGFNNDT